MNNKNGISVYPICVIYLLCVIYFLCVILLISVIRLFYAILKILVCFFKCFSLDLDLILYTAFVSESMKRSRILVALALCYVFLRLQFSRQARERLLKSKNSQNAQNLPYNYIIYIYKESFVRSDGQERSLIKINVPAPPLDRDAYALFSYLGYSDYEEVGDIRRPPFAPVLGCILIRIRAC